MSGRQKSSTRCVGEEKIEKLTPPVMVSISPDKALPTLTATPRTATGLFNGWVINDTLCRVPGIPFRFTFASPSKNDPNRLISEAVQARSKISTFIGACESSVFGIKLECICLKKLNAIRYRTIE